MTVGLELFQEALWAQQGLDTWNSCLAPLQEYINSSAVGSGDPRAPTPAMADGWQNCSSVDLESNYSCKLLTAVVMPGLKRDIPWPFIISLPLV